MHYLVDLLLKEEEREWGGKVETKFSVSPSGLDGECQMEGQVVFCVIFSFSAAADRIVLLFAPALLLYRHRSGKTLVVFTTNVW